MRKVILGFIGVLLLQCMTYTTHAQASLLTGLWVPVQQEMGGTALPAAGFATQELYISDSLYTLKAESIDKGVLKLSGNRMDIFSKEGVNAGKQFKAIYRMDREQLVICYDLTGKEYPAEFSTAGKPLWFMVVYKKKSLQQ
jgi:uncharacterized protein (TIGR03067 family)